MFRVARAMDLLLIGAVLFGSLRVVQLLGSAVSDPPLGFVLGIALVLSAGTWVGWRRSQRRWLVIVLTVLSLIAVFVGDGPMTLPLFVVALIALVLVYGSRAGVMVLCGMQALQLGIQFFVLGRSAADLVVQFMLSGLVFGLALVLAHLVAGLEVERRRNAALVGELRRSAEHEKELVLAQERARSARDLHDGLGHRLAAVGMSLDFATRMAERDSVRAWEEVAQARQQSAAALDAMRTWVRALDPVRVPGATGVVALDAIADSFRGTGLDVTVHSKGTERELPTAVMTYLYRFVQEGLTNALKHGGATRIDIVVNNDEPLVLEIADNGTAPDEVIDGYGLRTLREQAVELGGSVTAGAGRHGFTVRVEVPVP